jgi:thiol-disulfide isomerase/thioredoxin
VTSVDPARRRCAAALLLAAGGVHAAESGVQHHAWPPGRPTPPLMLPVLDGPPWRLDAAGGEVVLLNFWAGWCEPCRAELPSLQRLAERHAAERLQVLAVNFREGQDTIRRFLAHTPMRLPVLLDADGAAAKAWGASILPTSVVVGRDGRAAFSVVGEVDWDASTARAWMAPVLR